MHNTIPQALHVLEQRLAQMWGTSGGPSESNFELHSISFTTLGCESSTADIIKIAHQSFITALILELKSQLAPIDCK